MENVLIVLSHFWSLKTPLFPHGDCMEKSNQHIIQNVSFCAPRKKASPTILNNMRVSKTEVMVNFNCSQYKHQQGTDIVQLEEHYITERCHVAHECLQNGLSLRSIDSTGEEMVFVCRIGRALLPFTVTSLASSALLIISFREGSECMHAQPHVFYLRVCVCVCCCVGACLHVRIPPVDPSVTTEGVLKPITFSQKILQYF